MDLAAAPTVVIGIPCCLKTVNDHFVHTVSDKYVKGAIHAAGGMPMLIPAAGAAIDADILLERLDGLLIPGSPSNVEPHHYDGAASRPETVHDPERDGITLPLLRRAVAIGVPVLAICRGIQELNVALGGTLHQLVHEVAGRRDHRSKKGEPLDVRYGPAHTVALTPGGFFHTLTGATEILVNSLHAQGIDRLAEQLEIEAVAPDGQIEAVRGKASPGFCIGVQWHPEYKALENPVSRALFSHFGAACRARAAARAGRLAA